MRPEESLSPCPFCGGAAEPPRLVGHEASVIACSNCECSMTMNTRSRAIAAWNRRSPTPEHGGREGFVLVPREPTEAMLGARFINRYGVDVGYTRDAKLGLYRAMLSASLGGGEGVSSSSISSSGGTPRLRVGEAKSEGTGDH